MNQYILALFELLALREGPDELGIRQIVGELNQDAEMYSAVWAHLHPWQRKMIDSICGIQRQGDERESDRRREA
jgi:hypothetical protein